MEQLDAVYTIKYPCQTIYAMAGGSVIYIV